MNELAEKQEQPLAATQSPDTLLTLAVEKGADVESLERLMALKEKWDAQQVRAAFFSAISQFQQIVPRIEKTKHVSFPSKQGGRVDYWYAPLTDVVEQIKEPLKQCGLSFRWEFSDKDGWITATCVLTHVQGHSESTQMAAPADESGGKNVIQQRGSTMQYLQRYTLIGVLGLTTADSDMDGRLPKGEIETITEEQSADIQALIEEVEADKGKFLDYLKIDSLENLPAKDYNRAIKALEKKRQKA